MNVTHVSDGTAISNTVDRPVAFILVNGRKDFATFYETAQSRYEGFFVSHGDVFVKTVSRIVARAEPTGLELYHGERIAARRFEDAGVEAYWLAQGEPVLVYENTTGDAVTVRLDVREQFHIPHWGRHYDSREERYEGGGAVIVRYHDERLKEPVFLAILHDGAYRPLGSWVSVEYPRDERRNSRPSALYEYDLGEFAAGKLVIAFGVSEEEAMERARRHSDDPHAAAVLRTRVKAKPYKKADAAARRLARRCAEDALEALFIEDRMLAGLPWFTRAWVRDELICAPAFPRESAQAIIAKYLTQEADGGKLPVVFGGHNHCSDGLGLLAWAILSGRFALTEQGRQVLTPTLVRAVEALESAENGLGLVPSGPRESWMDSIERAGFPIETQALYSKVLQLTYQLTGDERYEAKRQRLLNGIRAHYYIGGHLHDRLYDETIRPNAFLAAFFAPAILSRAEWESSFEKMLPALWLEWGGLASVDTGHERFCDVSTGELDTSYHDGDSWFFVNNIAALVLHNVNQAKFKRYIDGILDASTEETLWHNYAGAPGEISSAGALESWGCGLQGFSAAAYLYLAERIPQKRRPLEGILTRPIK